MYPAGALIFVLIFTMGVLAGVWKGYGYGREKGRRETREQAANAHDRAQDYLVEAYKKGAHDAWVEAGMDPDDLQFEGGTDEKG